ncbi:MAG: efflux RND transporter periplasmic adaptor subunit [Gammaproteobacteria bacterium]|jgi:cobalt-zinc-cadmium efflux system membrane fusion protein|nr:efflux RND transporter periplasmic adaptor subunit [Gammaproteobacteria bacterium]MBP6052090.1 efflux RND transporter periplasmic adaptor subunit [Pseudomonadales bacterium]MBK6585208.1 efflux RND transporter periplasmic adaptor subunit [Gammaproteobacteria bacterium]MBK7520069.1 efflux RND transporter periplasmic adaptor subunit [Gammaproteobacteria bacterium]MBK7730670.1 efflux RND transporter periplasmic adaptor subunit [Gammaproteobacteria bacterium]
MKSLSRAFCTALLAVHLAAAAQVPPLVLEVSEAQSRAMGIETAPLVAAQWVRVARLPARVELDPALRRVLSARHSGTVVAVLAREGEEVRAGQAVLGLHSPEWAQAIASAQGNSARLRQATQAEARARALLEAGVIPRRELEAAQAELAGMRALAASDNARTAGGRIDDEGVIELPAPVSGRVLRRPVDAGSAVMAGDALLEIATGDALVALGSAPARLAGELDTGMRATTAAALDGTVSAVGSALDPATHALAVRFSLPAGAAAPGQMIELTVSRAAPADTVELPASAVVDIGGIASVFLVRENGFAVQRVSLLKSDSGSSWVRGAPAGERVVIRGVLALKSLAQAGASPEGE